MSLGYVSISTSSYICTYLQELVDAQSSVVYCQRRLNVLVWLVREVLGKW
jgi:hypothetical protein